MNFKQHFTEQMSINIAAGWITPTGKRVNVPFGSHDQYVLDNKDTFGITDEDIKNLEEFTLVKKLAILNGAVRFHLYIPYAGAKPIATVGATPAAFRKFKSIIDDIMIEGRATNYDVYLTAEDGEFLGAKQTSIFESNEDEIYLWLDDVRPMKEGFNKWAKTAEEAIEYLKTGKVVKISLDHDLGMEITDGLGPIVSAREDKEKKTGYDVAKWIEEAAYYKRIKPIEWAVHSANPIGAKRIMEAMRMADQYWSHHDTKERSDML